MKSYLQKLLDTKALRDHAAEHVSMKFEVSQRVTSAFVDIVRATSAAFDSFASAAQKCGTAKEGDQQHLRPADEVFGACADSLTKEMTSICEELKEWAGVICTQVHERLHAPGLVLSTSSVEGLQKHNTWVADLEKLVASKLLHESVLELPLDPETVNAVLKDPHTEVWREG